MCSVTKAAGSSCERRDGKCLLAWVQRRPLVMCQGQVFGRKGRKVLGAKSLDIEG